MSAKKPSRKVGGNSAEGRTDNSVFLSQHRKINFELNIRDYELTEKQKIIVETMTHKETRVVNLNSIWGVGKTFCSVLAALNLLKDERARKIYYIRSAAEASDCPKIGLLPGEIQDKVAVYNEVLMEKLNEFLPSIQVDRLIKDGYVECLPPNYLRGRTFNNCVLICDEAENFSKNTILLILSRMGERSRAFFIGDSDIQTDIKNGGFREYYDLFNDEESRSNGVWSFEQRDSKDIMRSGFLRFVMEKVGLAKKDSLL